MAILTAKDNAGFVAALKACVPGDEIQLGDGAYGLLLVNGVVRASPGVTIRPAPNAKPAISGVTVQGGASGFTFSGLEIRMAPTQQYGVLVVGSSAVMLDGLAVRQADDSLRGVGVFIRASRDVTAKGCELHHLGVGLTSLDSSGVTVEDCRVHHVQTDGMDYAGSSEVVVRGNRIRDLFPAEGAHPDAIQFWATAKNPKPSNILIEGNSYDRGRGGIGQGIFIASCAELTIRDNTLRGCMYNGISLAGCDGAEIAGNFVQGYPDMGSRIIVRGASRNVRIEGNAAEAVVDYPANGANVNLVIGENRTIGGGAADDLAELNAWRGRNAPAADPRDAEIATLRAQLAELAAALSTAEAARQEAARRGAELTAVIASIGALAAKAAA